MSSSLFNQHVSLVLIVSFVSLKPCSFTGAVKWGAASKIYSKQYETFQRRFYPVFFQSVR